MISAAHSSALPDVSLGAASALSCSPTERSTEEETPIARRAVSGSLCVCVRNLRSLLMVFVLGARQFDSQRTANIKRRGLLGRDHLVTPFRIGRRISKGDTRNTVESTGQKAGILTFLPSVPTTWKESCCFLGRGLCSPTERSIGEETPIAWAVSGSFVCFLSVCSE